MTSRRPGTSPSGTSDRAVNENASPDTNNHSAGGSVLMQAASQST